MECVLTALLFSMQINTYTQLPPVSNSLIVHWIIGRAVQSAKTCILMYVHISMRLSRKLKQQWVVARIAHMSAAHSETDGPVTQAPDWEIDCPDPDDDEDIESTTEHEELQSDKERDYAPPRRLQQLATAALYELGPVAIPLVMSRISIIFAVVLPIYGAWVSLVGIGVFRIPTQMMPLGERLCTPNHTNLITHLAILIVVSVILISDFIKH